MKKHPVAEKLALVRESKKANEARLEQVRNKNKLSGREVLQARLSFRPLDRASDLLRPISTSGIAEPLRKLHLHHLTTLDLSSFGRVHHHTKPSHLPASISKASPRTRHIVPRFQVRAHRMRPPESQRPRPRANRQSANCSCLDDVARLRELAPFLFYHLDCIAVAWIMSN